MVIQRQWDLNSNYWPVRWGLKYRYVPHNDVSVKDGPHIRSGPIRLYYNMIILYYNTVCPTRYRTRHFFNNSNTNEDIATKFEQEYVRCVRNEEECVCSVCL